MTILEQGRKVTRLTRASIQHRPLIVTMFPEHLELRRHGTRERLTLTYETIYRQATIREAAKERQECALLKFARKRGNA